MNTTPTDRLKALVRKFGKYGRSQTRSVSRYDMNMLLEIAQTAKALRNEDSDQNVCPCPIMRKTLRDKLDMLLREFYK